MRKAIVTALFVTAFATSMIAQSKPNFSGTWKLNLAKSDFGPLPAPDSRTDVIDHNDPTMKINTSQSGGQGDMTATLTYTTDGKEAKLMFNDAEVTIKSVWTLSEDGKTLTQDSHITSPMGELDQKQVFEKQDGSTVAKAAPAAIVATPASAGPKPNFSGTWKLDVSKSDFGILPPPNSRTDVIEHNDPVLKISVSQDGSDGKQSYTMNFTTDGKEATNTAGGLELKSILTWDGSNLVDNAKFKYQDNDVIAKDIWLLSDDGKTLTQNAHYTSPMGEMDTKLVFAKVSAQ